jgi:hypothetical protein
MAESVTAVVTKPVGALADFAKKYWIAAIVILLLLVALVMRYRQAVLDKTATAPTWVKSFLKVGGFLVPFGVVFLCGDALAAVGRSTCCAVNDSGGILSTAWHWIVALAGGGGIAFGISAFSAPDSLDMKSSNGGRSISYTPGAAQSVSLYLDTETKNRSKGGAPLVAVDTTIAIDTTVNQPSTGTSSLEEDDLARLMAYLEIDTPELGTVLSQTTGTGPVLDLVINFIGQGFNRGADTPTAALTVPGSNSTATARTKYFTFPWAQRYLWDPSTTCPWVRILHNMNCKIGLAASTALGAVSTGATTSGTSYVRATTSYIPHAYWFQPLIPYWRLDTPASGSDGLKFENFGAAGPKATDPIDYVHTIGQLSNLKGLPGNLTLDTVTGIIAESFGLDDVQNVDHLVSERLKAQRSGRTPYAPFSLGGNHKQGAGTNKMALADLLFLLLRQPSLDMTVNHMLPFASGKTLPLRETFSSTRTGADAFIVGALRSISQGYRAKFAEFEGSKLPVSGAPVPFRKVA